MIIHSSSDTQVEGSSLMMKIIFIECFCVVVRVRTKRLHQGVVEYVLQKQCAFKV
ncbi:hypothetical protein BDZ94DRAFT_1246773 [Collybia nuda]|uniref:Uncharacterized protein n=1 Tax=Collybia nuda TaxID=64659 RepID=A0A9P5YIW4_9AGAR|nr:hypothetical protein BDZ94DRAFT_1246773 [Collybia nuda]